MKVETRRLRVGDFVSVHPCHGGYELPPELRPGTRVRIVEVGYGWTLTEDEHGRRWRLAFNNLEMPCIVWMFGRWVDQMAGPLAEEVIVAEKARHTHRWQADAIAAPFIGGPPPLAPQ